MSEGTWIEVDRRDLVQKQIMYSGCWDSEVGDALKDVLTKDDVFFDIGANIGYFTLLAASFGARTVVAFEPFEPLAQQAEDNVCRNKLEGVARVVKIGLGARPGKVRYFPGPIANSGAGTLLTRGAVSSDATVDVETLDAFISQYGLTPTVLKIDVEGGEADVLRGAAELLVRNPPRAIVFEAKSMHDGSLGDPIIASILTDAGYRIRHLTRLQKEPLENYLATLE